jgi:hypothetical protein
MRPEDQGEGRDKGHEERLGRRGEEGRRRPQVEDPGDSGRRLRLTSCGSCGAPQGAWHL